MGKKEVVSRMWDLTVAEEPRVMLECRDRSDARSGEHRWDEHLLSPTLHQCTRPPLLRKGRWAHAAFEAPQNSLQLGKTFSSPYIDLFRPL